MGVFWGKEGNNLESGSKWGYFQSKHPPPEVEPRHVFKEMPTGAGHFQSKHPSKAELMGIYFSGMPLGEHLLLECPALRLLTDINKHWQLKNKFASL